MKKRMLWLLLPFFAGVIAITAFAESTLPELRVAEVSVKQGESVTVPLFITGNPGVAAMQLSLSFDDKISLSSVSAGADFADASIIKSPDGVTPVRILWATTNAKQKDGELLLLSFAIPASVEAGAYSVNVVCNSANDGSENTIAISPLSFTINVVALTEEEKSTLQISDAIGQVGEQVTVTLMSSNKFSAAVGELDIVYDSTVLELVDIVPAEKYANSIYTGVDSAKLAWASLEEIGEGDIATLTFKLLSDNTGDYPAEVSVIGKLYDVYENQITGVRYKSGYISRMVLGDINEDGEVTILDVLIILRGVLNNDTEGLPDTNEDGKVSLIDIIRVLKMCV